MNPYHHPDYAAFVAALRKSPDDRVTPLVCADWLEERSKADHARFVRGCVRMAELRDILDECAKQDLSYSDPTRAVPNAELMDLVHNLRGHIERYAHEWTAGGAGRFVNPTAYDWKNGFLWRWSVHMGDHPAVERNTLKSLAALLARQPITDVAVTLPSEAAVDYETMVVSDLAARFRGVTFRHGSFSVSHPAEEGVTNG